MTTAPKELTAIETIYQYDPITLLDDLIQLLANDEHHDLAWRIHEVLCDLDERRHAAIRAAKA